MLKKEIKEIIRKSEKWGWVLEPDAQKIFSLYGFKTPQYDVALSGDQAVAIARRIGYPVVAKIVSPAIIHKSDVKGVVVGIKDDETLIQTLERFRKLDGFVGMLIAEMVRGLELIVGAKNDFQFGPMILLGMGGVGVEIYKDVSLRMAPLTSRDADHMINQLTARKLLTGYRGAEPVNMNALRKTIITFSRLMMDLKDVIESVDLNPVMCTAKACTVVDSRIMLLK
ncbi:MAG: acetate--CoA ligase family protein [Deltaproteobacteria bacterium]